MGQGRPGVSYGGSRKSGEAVRETSESPEVLRGCAEGQDSYGAVARKSLPARLRESVREWLLDLIVIL